MQALPSQSLEESNLQNLTLTQGGDGDVPGKKGARGKAPGGMGREGLSRDDIRPMEDGWNERNLNHFSASS